MSTKHRPGYMPWDRTGNRVLVQSELGRNKPSNYNLPDDHFIYGKNTPQDPQKVNDMMYNWSYHQNSDNKNIGKVKDLIKTNKSALRSMVHTSHGNFDFRKTNTVYKDIKQGSNHIQIKLPQENFTYGKPGDLQDPIRNVLANTYGQDDKKFRHTMYQTKFSNESQPKRKLSCYMTKNHHLVKQATAKRMALFDWARRDNLKQQWKLSKFNAVGYKVDTRNKAASFTAAHTPKQQDNNERNAIEAQN